MNYLQAVQEITEVVPDFGNEVKEIKIQNSYIIRTFTERIKNMIRQNDRNLLFRSLQKMDKIYNDGDSVLKNAIETILSILWTILQLFAAGMTEK
jgi:hypothetical protein